MSADMIGERTAAGTPFVDVLRARGVLVGIKVDRGLEPLAGAADGETSTKGLDGLEERCAEYHRMGARFAKWRATLKVDPGAGCPTPAALDANCRQLARYAKACQRARLVPIVEPEVLLAGAHSAAEAGAATARMLGRLCEEFGREGVDLAALLLKLQMVLPGSDAPGPRPAPDEVAEATLATFRRSIPAEVPGVVFLSGGQTEEEATVRLDAIARQARAAGDVPWALSFSYGRALQASVLRAWRPGQREAEAAAQQVAARLAAANGAAARGEYAGPHPSAAGGGSGRGGGGAGGRAAV